MKTVMVLLIQLLIFSNFFAQKVSISAPVNIRNEKSFELMNIHTKPLVFRQNNNDFLLGVYENNLGNFFEKKLSFEKKNAEVVASSYNEKSLIIFYSYELKGDGFIKAMRINEKGDKTDSIELLKASAKLEDEDFKNTESEDKSKSVLFRSNNNSEMEFIVTDNLNFKKLYSKTIKIKDIKTNTEFRKISITNEGVVYVIFQKIPGLFNKYNNKIIIIKIDPMEPEFKKKELELEFYFDNFRVIFDNLNKNLIIAGSKNKLFQNKSEGYFAIDLNSELEIKYIRQNPFSKKLLEDYYKSTKLRSYVNNLKVKDIIPRNDGGFIVIFEKVEIITRQSGGDFRMRYPSYIESTDNFYGEIIIVSIHENGEEFWSEVIRKNQISSNDQGIYSSFAIMKSSGRISLIFNDEIKDETQIIMYSVNPLGNFSRISLFNTELYDLKLLLRESIQISSKSLLIPSYNKDKLKLVLLELTDI